MISEQRRRVIEIIGEQHSEQLRAILKQIVVVKWEMPQHRFSPIMIEHLLYFVAKTIPITTLDIFPLLLTLKFTEEYGYNDCHAMLPKLIEDLVGTLRAYCIKHFDVDRIAAQRAIEKVFKEPLILFLDGYLIDSKSEDSIREISGLPLSFLTDFFEGYNSFDKRQMVSNDKNILFTQLFHTIHKQYMLTNGDDRDQ